MQTAQVLSSTRDSAALSHIAREGHARRRDGCAGNRSLMRAAPVALAHPGNDASIAWTARAISDVTHGDPLCGDACVLWCTAIDRAIRDPRSAKIGSTASTMALALLPHEVRPPWRMWIERARRSRMRCRNVVRARSR